MNKTFALTLGIGIALTVSGAYFLLGYRDNSYYAPQSSNLEGRAVFSFLPFPAPGEHPMQVNAVLFPLVGRTNTSSLHLSLGASFPESEPWVSFLFESTFHVVGSPLNSSSGVNGVGSWRIFPWSNHSGQPETMVQYLFNKSSTAKDRLSFNADITLNFTGLPFLYDHGRYTILFPFNTNGGGYTANNGFFVVGIPKGFLFSSANEPLEITPPDRSGAGQSLQSRLNQSSELIISYDDPASERAYSNYQTAGLFLMGVGVPSVISSVPLYHHMKKVSHTTEE